MGRGKEKEVLVRVMSAVVLVCGTTTSVVSDRKNEEFGCRLGRSRGTMTMTTMMMAAAAEGERVRGVRGERRGEKLLARRKKVEEGY